MRNDYFSLPHRRHGLPANEKGPLRWVLRCRMWVGLVVNPAKSAAFFKTGQSTDRPSARFATRLVLAVLSVSFWRPCARKFQSFSERQAGAWRNKADRIEEEAVPLPESVLVTRRPCGVLQGNVGPDDRSLPSSSSSVSYLHLSQTAFDS